MLKQVEIDKSVAQVKATMEIEGLKLSIRDIKILKKVAEGKLNSDKLIEEYKRRVIRLMENKK